MNNAKNYITKENLDATKTYYKYVDIVVRKENCESVFMEKMPANKKYRTEIIQRLHANIESVEVLRTWFRLKEKWIQY